MGYFTRTRRAGLWLYPIAWAVVFPIQTAVVFTSTGPGSDDYLYWVFDALFLAVGIALNLLGSALRERRARATRRSFPWASDTLVPSGVVYRDGVRWSGARGGAASCERRHG